MGVAKNRELNLDALRGFAILGVIGLHSLGNSARHYTVPKSVAWWFVMLSNRSLNFVVPLFLALSALLYAKAATERGSMPWGKFQAKRLPSILYPYLLWSFIAFGFRLVADGGKANLLAPETFLPMLLWGKAMFHLYFLVILVQVVLLFPLLNAWVGRYSGKFPGLVAIACGAQFAAFLVQSQIKLPYPATTFLWYITPVIPAIWLGQHYKKFVDHPCRICMMTRNLLALISLALFMAVSYLELDNQPVNGLVSNTALQAYGLFSTLMFLGVAAQSTSAPTKIQRALGWIGQRSLAMYLIHPFLMRFLGGPSITGFVGKTYVGPIVAYGLLVGATVSIVLIFEVTRIDWVLLGPSAWPKKSVVQAAT